MKYIKPINEFFGPFKKKSDEDKIALDFLKRVKKITPENNPYEIKKVDGDDVRDLQSKGVKILSPYNVYKITFDDVDIIICGYQYYHPHLHLRPDGDVFTGEIYVKSHDEDNIDEIKCNKDITFEIFKIIEKIYKNDDGKSKQRLDRIKRSINPAADLLESKEYNRDKYCIIPRDLLDGIKDICLELEDEGYKVLFVGTHRGECDFSVIISKKNSSVGKFLFDKELTSTIRRLKEYVESLGYNVENNYPYETNLDRTLGSDVGSETFLPLQFTPQAI